MSAIGISDPFGLPGTGTLFTSLETDVLWGPLHRWMWKNVILLSSTTDAGNSPTTTLRGGLALGKVTATGKYKVYSPTATDGSQFPELILGKAVNMLGQDGAAADQYAPAILTGMVKAAQIPNLDENVRRCLHGRFIFDDRLIGSPADFTNVVALTADYTLVAADANKVFTNQGAAGAVVATLPATIIPGWRCKFFIEANQNLTITAPAGKLVVFNNAAATSIAFSTSSEKIGAGVEIMTNADGTKYLAFVSLGAETQTPTIA